ncbi:MAG: hypothetical protein WBM54_04840 [Woeseia sp.]
MLGALLAATVSLAADIRISDLRDVNFGSVPPTAGRLVSTMDFCVGLDKNGGYQVIARGTGPADAFTLSNGVHNIPYSLRYSDNPGRPGTLMRPGIPETGLNAKKRKKNGGDCNKPSASIEFAIESADLQAAGAGQYSGTLMLTVTPE